MMRLAAKVLSKASRNGNKFLSFSLHKPPPTPPPKASPPVPLTRHFSTKSTIFSANPVALEMINYATSLARDGKTDDSYARGLMILEQCESNQPDDNSKALAKLARSTLFFERGSNEEAIEKLQKIQDLSWPSIALKFAASEALAGIYLEHYQEDAALVVADLALQLLGTIRLEVSNESGFEVLEARAKALKGLVELIRCNHDSAQPFFEGIEGDCCFSGNAVLSYGEFFHGMHKFPIAKNMYQKVIDRMSEAKDFSDPDNIGACNMTPSEIATAATCALGQLEAHTGNFIAAEDILTEALKKMEERLGTRHPKVGVVLTCLALMYRLKATVERSSSLLIQEGLFRKAIELLKAPSLEVDCGKSLFYSNVFSFPYANALQGLFRKAIELLKAPSLEVDCGAGKNAHMNDIIALARGGFAETLIVQQSRKTEGERLKKWAEMAWGNRRMSLGEALEVSESCSKVVPVIDTRICRVL